MRGPGHRVCGAVLAIALCAIATDQVFGSSEVPDFEFLPRPGAGAEQSRPLPKFRYMFGPPVRWIGPLRWKYNHAGAPSPFAGNPTSALASIRAALEAWTGSCGITTIYDGETTIPPNYRTATPQGEQPDEVNVVGWGALEQDTSGVAYVWYDILPDGYRLADADIILSPSHVNSTVDMLRTGSHEWGHALGLAHSDVGGAMMSGPPDTPYTGMTAPQRDDIRGCRCLYGPAAGQQAGYACSLPGRVELGAVPVGGASAPYRLTINNGGNAALTVHGVATSSSRVSTNGGCPINRVLAPNESCMFEVVARPDVVLDLAELVTVDTSDGPYSIEVLFRGTPASSVIQLVEYHHGAFNHYFVTHLPDEIGKLDSGTFDGWVRTGRAINAWKEPGAASSPVCRFFSQTFAPRSSHFYTASAIECQNVKGDPVWSFEGDVFHVALPNPQGTCAIGTQPVFRLYNDGQGGAPNHRFTTDSVVRQQMIAQGWVAEGTGLGVTMCAPN